MSFFSGLPMPMWYLNLPCVNHRTRMPSMTKAYDQLMDSILSPLGCTRCAKLHAFEFLLEIPLAVCLACATEPQRVLTGFFGSWFFIPFVMDIARLVFVLADVMGGRCDAWAMSVFQVITLLVFPQFLLWLWMLFCWGVSNQSLLVKFTPMIFAALFVPRIIVFSFIMITIRREVLRAALPTTARPMPPRNHKRLQSLVLDTFIVGVETEGTEQEETCVICLAMYLPEENVCVLNCHHTFHSSCIEDWILSGVNGGARCPMRCEPPLRLSNSFPKTMSAPV